MRKLRNLYQYLSELKASSLIEAIFSMVILSICITAFTLAIFYLTSETNGIQIMVDEQSRTNQYRVNQGTEIRHTFDAKKTVANPLRVNCDFNER